MGSKDPNERNIKGAFSPRDLEILDVAYRSAWAKLRLRDPDKSEGLKDFLRQKVVQIAKYGVKDPDTLAGLALDMLPKERPQSSGVQKRSKKFPRRILQI